MILHKSSIDSNFKDARIGLSKSIVTELVKARIACRCVASD
uniref:Uncharacterized protein n=1 Tax=Arundo donax TaxID=35708 RepID=A0A0A9BD25_ARUDO